jgi:hypothetical protein
MRLYSFFPAAVMFWFLDEAAALGAKSILQPRSTNTVDIPFYTLVSIKHSNLLYLFSSWRFDANKKTILARRRISNIYKCNSRHSWAASRITNPYVLG